MIKIANGPRLEAHHLAARPWGGAFMREMDLVIAAGELDSQQTGATLYDAVLQARIADICSALDLDCTPLFDGVTDLGSSDQSDPRVQAAAQRLAALPRGGWAVWRTPEGCGLYGSDGIGGIRPSYSPVFGPREAMCVSDGFRTAYGSVLGSIVYDRRRHIGNRIAEATIAAAKLEKGTRIKNAAVGATQWSNVVYDGVVPGYYAGGTDAYRLAVSKPGKRSAYTVNSDALRRIFSLVPTMPDEYQDAGNPQHLQSLRESRMTAAQATWDEHGSSIAYGFDPRWGSRAGFSFDGDVCTRTVLAGQDDPRGVFRITFAPGTSDPIDWGYTETADTPIPEPA